LDDAGEEEMEQQEENERKDIRRWIIQTKMTKE
jgi:hypothetical protein